MIPGLAIRAALVKLPWRIIGPVAGVIAVLMLAYCSGRSDGGQKAKTSLAVERGNVTALTDGVKAQNAATAKQGQQQEAVAKASTKAIQRGAERRGRVDAAAARVEAVQPSGGLVVPDDVRALWRDL